MKQVSHVKRRATSHVVCFIVISIVNLRIVRIPNGLLYFLIVKLRIVNISIVLLSFSHVNLKTIYDFIVLLAFSIG